MTFKTIFSATFLSLAVMKTGLGLISVQPVLHVISSGFIFFPFRCFIFFSPEFFNFSRFPRPTLFVASQKRNRSLEKEGTLWRRLAKIFLGQAYFLTKFVYVKAGNSLQLTDKTPEVSLSCVKE